MHSTVQCSMRTCCHLHRSVFVFSWRKTEPWSKLELCTLAVVSLLWGLICTCSSTFSTGPSPGQKDNCRTTSQSMEMLNHGTESERVVIKIRPGAWVTSCSNQPRDSLLHNRSSQIGETYTCKGYCSHQWQREFGKSWWITNLNHLYTHTQS